MAEQTMGQRSKELAKGLFGGIGEAKVRIDSSWEKAGHYLERIDLVKLDQNRSKQTAVFIEKTIIHVFDDADGEGHRVGDSVSHAIWQRFDSFLGNVKRFLMTTLGLEKDEVGEDHVFQVVDDDQPLAGTIIECKNYVTMTKKDTPFTVIGYKREVPASDLIRILSDEVKELYFPDGLLEKMLEFEQENEAEA